MIVYSHIQFYFRSTYIDLKIIVRVKSSVTVVKQ